MAPGQQIAGRYDIDSRLGAGGMSTVFRATDNVLERAVAVKLLAEHLADDEAFVARFRREALAAARLQHPNVVQVFDSGLDERSHRHFIVMELVEGPSGADMLRDQKQLDISQTVAIARDACHGLDYAHRAGVIHRDVKPGNLLLAEQTGVTKLADFGIAKAAEQTRITQVGSVLGTAAYLSPEQARGDEAGPTSDIYSLGVCAYQFIAGRLPHEYGSITELALKQEEEPVQPLTEIRSDVPVALDQAIRNCLESDPAQRYSSGLELAEALEAGLHGTQTEATRRIADAALPIDDPDATRALGDLTEATRQLRARTERSARPPLPPVAPGEREARRSDTADAAVVDPEAEKEAKRKKRRRQLLIGFLVLAIGVVVALLILAAGDGGGSSVSPVDEGDVQSQIDSLRQFLQDHTQ